MRRTAPGYFCQLVIRAGTAALVVIGTLITSAAAEEGQIVILRVVPPRIAYREAPPAPPFAVSTTPDVDVSATRRIGPGVVASVPGAALISDLEAAGISANMSILNGLGELAFGIDRGISRPLSGRLSRTTTGATVRALRSLPNQLGIEGPTRLVAGGSSVQRATTGLGQTISNAVVPQ